jgi:tetratricopeptide (TPR) repeat protein
LFIRSVLALTVLVLGVLAWLQFASDAIFARTGSPVSLPAHLSLQFGVRVYRSLEGVWGAPFVEAMLARAALDQGDIAAAREHVRRMPPSASRSALAGRVALASGQHAAAVADFLAALDIDELQRETDRLQRSGDLVHAYDLESATRARLAQAGTHPDAVAESYWRSGVLARGLAAQDRRASDKWLRAALDDYRQAFSLAPWSGKYWLEAGTAALVVGELKDARVYYQRAIEVDPRMADAYAGLGVIALRNGDRPTALWYAARSRSLSPASTMLRRLDRGLR